jgi:hypothetical protein
MQQRLRSCKLCQSCGRGRYKDSLTFLSHHLRCEMLQEGGNVYFATVTYLECACLGQKHQKALLWVSCAISFALGNFHCC